MSEQGIKNTKLSLWPDIHWKVQRLDYDSSLDGYSDWALWIDGRPGGDLAVVLHGHGSFGDRHLVRPDIRQSWLPAMMSAGLHILFPTLRNNAWMSPAAVHDLRDLITWAQNRVHPPRTFLCGGSMGGTSALIYASLRPAKIDGVMALCPAADLPGYWKWASERKDQSSTHNDISQAIEASYGATPLQSPALFQQHNATAQQNNLTMPIALSHGTADTVIPFEPTRALAQSLSGRTPVRYVELEGGDHEAPVSHFPELLSWLMEKS